MKELLKVLWLLLEELRKLNQGIPVLKKELGKTETVQRLREEKKEIEESALRQLRKRDKN